MDFPLWSLYPAILLFTSLFFTINHMNYTIEDWFIGNGLILFSIFLVYIGGYIKNKIGDGKYKR